MQRAVSAANTKQRGFSLLEVVVSAAILSSGLAGVAALLITAVAGTSDAADRSTASFLAGSLASLARISPAQTAVFLETAPEHPPECNESQHCSAPEFAGSNYRAWQQEVSRQLPGGTGIVCYDATPGDGNGSDHACDGSGALHIKVFWQTRPGSNGLESRLVKALPS